MQMKHQITQPTKALPMNVLSKLAFSCHLLAAFLLCLFGLTYLFRHEFMPYHAEAVEREWSAVEPSFQILITAFMKIVGSAWLASALAMIILLSIPFRKGERWAYGAVPAVGLTATIPSLLATLYVGNNTPASPPWLPALAGILLLVIGFILSTRLKINS